MRYLLIIISILSLVGTCDVFGQDDGASKPFVLHLSHDSDPKAVWVTFFMTGSFGGYGSFVRMDAKTWDYVVPTSDEAGLPAKKMRLIINSSKYKTRFFDLPESKDQDRVIDLKLEPRGTLKFTGKVLSQDKLSGKRLQVRIGFVEHWLCDYFGLADCFGGTQSVMSVALDKDGRFKVDLPDFASDPVIASFGYRGEFLFDIRDKKTGRILYNLRPENGRKGLDEIPVASSYPTEQVFIAEWSN